MGTRLRRGKQLPTAICFSGRCFVKRVMLGDFPEKARNGSTPLARKGIGNGALQLDYGGSIPPRFTKHRPRQGAN